MARMRDDSGDRRPMQRLVEASDPDRLTPNQRQAVEEVWAMAREFSTLPGMSQPAYLAEVRKHTSGRQRNLATRHTATDSSNFTPLMALLDALIADESFATKQGTFLRSDLEETGARVVVEDGRQMIQFPIRWPWKVRPNPEGRTAEEIAGVRGDPIYRSKDQRGPHYHSFRRVKADEPSDPTREPKEWFDE